MGGASTPSGPGNEAFHHGTLDKVMVACDYSTIVRHPAHHGGVHAIRDLHAGD